MVWWAVICGTALFSFAGLASIYFVAVSNKNIECKVPLGIRALVATLLTSWCVIAGGTGGILPFHSIYVVIVFFGGLSPVDYGGWILFGILIFQIIFHYVVFYFLTVKKENNLIRAHYIATGKRLGPTN